MNSERVQNHIVGYLKALVGSFFDAAESPGSDRNLSSECAQNHIVGCLRALIGFLIDGDQINRRRPELEQRMRSKPHWGLSQGTH